MLIAPITFSSGCSFSIWYSPLSLSLRFWRGRGTDGTTLQAVQLYHSLVLPHTQASHSRSAIHTCHEEEGGGGYTRQSVRHCCVYMFLCQALSMYSTTLHANYSPFCILYMRTSCTYMCTYDNTSLVSGMTQVIHKFQDVARAISRVSLHSVIIMYHPHPHNSHSSHTHPPTHTITPHTLSTCTRTPTLTSHTPLSALRDGTAGVQWAAE